MASVSRVAPVADAVTTEPWDARLDRRATALVFLVTWCIYLATATYSVAQINDARASTQSAYALVTTGSLALPQEWEGEADWEVEGRDGRSYTNRFPLMPLYAAPFHAIALAFGDGDRPQHPHLISYAPSGVAAATVAAGAVTVSFLLFRRLAPRRLAIVATGALAFGTAVWTISADVLWPHGLTHLLLALGLLAAADGRSARAGASFGLMLLARPHLAVVPAVVGLWSGWQQRRLLPVAVMGTLSLLGLLAVMVYSQQLFGTWLPIAGYNTYAVDNLTAVSPTDQLERFVLFLGDPARGVMIYTPVLLVLLPFVVRGWRVSPWWVRAGAIAGLLYLAVQLRANAHHGGAGFFGPRLHLESLILSAPLLLRTYQAYHQGRRWAAPAVHVLLVFGVLFHALGATVWKFPFNETSAGWADQIVTLCTEESYTAGCPDDLEPLREVAERLPDDDEHAEVEE